MRGKKGKEVETKKNQGFSLVELIVVIAIMAILAVIFAPRLTQYLDRARQSNDHEIVNGVAKAVQMGLVEDSIYNQMCGGAYTPTYKDSTKGYNILNYYSYDSNKKYTATRPGSTDLLGQQIVDIVGNFTLKSDNVDTSKTQIIVVVTDRNKFGVYLYYDGLTSGTNPGESSADFSVVVE